MKKIYLQPFLEEEEGVFILSLPCYHAERKDKYAHIGKWHS